MVAFNATKFCYLVGDTAGLAESYRLTLLVIFSCIDLLVILTNIFAMAGILRNFKQFFTKGKIFVVTLLLVDFSCGCTFLTLFVIELSVQRVKINCAISSWRVIFFVYCLSTRILCMFFISFQSFIKTCRQTTRLEYRFDKYTSLINILGVWMPGVVAIVTVASFNVKTNKVLGSILYLYFLVLIMCSIACYAMVLKSVKGAKRRNNADIYSTALYYIKMVLIWFLMTNIPLAICGFVLLVYAFFPEQKTRDQWVVQLIHIICLSMTALNVTINPMFFIQKFENVKKSILCSCSKGKSTLSCTSGRVTEKSVEVTAKEIVHLGVTAYQYRNANEYIWC